MKVLLLVFVVIVLFLALRRRRRRRFLQLELPRGGREDNVSVGGVTRKWTLYRPGALHAGPRPLMICFHGGSGDASRFARGSGLVASALRHGFAAAFPEAPAGWEDARLERGGGRGDLDFVERMVEKVAADPGIDSARIFALGVSNGGMFVMRLACERPQLFAGFAALLANLPAAQPETDTSEVSPRPIAMVFGLEDRVMPGQGGEVRRARGRGIGGRVLSREETIAFWVAHNRAGPPERTALQPGRTVGVRDYRAQGGGAPVRVIEIEGWGHKWPRWAVDRLRHGREFDATDLIWSFFGGAPFLPAPPAGESWSG